MENVIESNQSKRKLTAGILSGILLGLSVPNFSPVPLGFLAWFWLVPILFEFKQTETFKSFLIQSFIAVCLGFSIITLWVVNASVMGFFASVLSGTFVWIVPLIVFYFVRRWFDWKFALVSLPFVWVVWEWFYHSTEFSFGAVRLGIATQAEMLYLIQFADLFGVHGVTFWLITVNLLIFLLLEKIGQINFGETTFSKIRNALQTRFLLVVLAFIAPLGYSGYVFNKISPPEKELTVLAIQPNISPFIDFTPNQNLAITVKQSGLTETALKTNKPDLIIWHEVAIPYFLLTDENANRFLANNLQKWKTPLLTGVFEKNGEATFNAAFLFSNDQIANQTIPIDVKNMYAKRRLMPFIERVPYLETFPWLSDFTIKIGTRPFLTPGTEAKVLSFQTKTGETAQVGTLICYENLYPELSADLVRNGAEFLASITNEGWFANSHGQHQLAVFSRFRSIETRREMVRVGATGVTWITDKFGRIRQTVPAWSEQTMFGTVKLSDERTFYVEHPELFPQLCGVVFLMLLFGRILRRVRIK